MLKKVFKVAGVVLLVAVVGLAVFVATFKPDQRPAPDVTIEATPDAVARGKYLVDHVSACSECHSQRDWTRYGAPIKGTPLVGGECLDESWGMPGTICAPNLTPHDKHGIGAWTDGELLRALREGVDRDGVRVFPSMPYGVYRNMSDDDARAIIAYLRSVEPNANAVPESDITFPASFFTKLAPKPLEGEVTAPGKSDTKAYGEYLATIAGCIFCHTPVDEKHQPIEGMKLAGGHEFKGIFGTQRSANITPHKTGLKKTREAFINVFKAYSDPQSASEVAPKDNTVMPWLSYGGMTEEDLGAIYDYLQTAKPVDHEVR